MTQWEGTASICDENGKLLLYTNGIQIWNNKHKVIEGATDLGGNDSATQSAIIIPKPGDPNIYYVFTTFSYLSCIIVDISLNQGEGGIVSKNILMEHSTEKLTAVQHCNGLDFWILVHEAGNNTFRNYLLTKDGLAKSYVENRIGNSQHSSLGYLKFSPSGTKLAAALWGRGIVELYDFDTSTGIISNPVTIKHQDFFKAYGLEFSPDESFLYVTETLETASRIFQLDISDKNPVTILKSKTTIGQTAVSYFGALKMGPDNRIYVAKNRMKNLGVINNPNSKGISCGYVSDGLELGAVSGIGLPNFVSTFNLQKSTLAIIEDKNCNDITLTADFYPASTNTVYQWYDGNSKIETAKEKTFRPDRSGLYSVVVRNHCSIEKITSPEIKVQILKAEPEAIKVNCGFYKLITNANTDFEWTGETIKTSDQNTDSIVVSGTGSKTFKLKVFDHEDPTCFIEKQLHIDFGICDARVFIPAIFTPNQDGINDTFKIIIIGGTPLKLEIFNRWGSLIFTDSSPAAEWSGKMNNSTHENGDYVYVFKYKTEMGEEFVRKGSILLQR